MQVQTKITDWYQKLVSDLKAIVQEGNRQLVMSKWIIGDRILKDHLKFKKAKYGEKTIENLAGDVGISIADLFRCLQFRKQYPQIEGEKEILKLPWSKIRSKYLTKNSPTGENSEEESEPTPLPIGVFNVIYSDPPWRYDFAKSPTRTIEKQYQTMELEDIKELEIPAAENSVLFLWATAPKLREAFEVMDAWGFEYKTHAIWDKKIIGMGYWFRGQHELLLVGTKGNVSPPLEEARISSVIPIQREKHSKKPEFFYELIEKMFPQSKYLELFSRENREQWECWGNEIKMEEK